MNLQHPTEQGPQVTSPPFINADQLKQNYGVFGHFYSVQLASKEVIECRSVLEIANHNILPEDHSKLSSRRPDAVFIMMNPGSSRPLVGVNNRIRAKKMNILPISLVPTMPDKTQYQVMRVMHFREWKHVRVLNLSDLRSSKSPEFIKSFQRLEREHGFESHSIFSAERKDELRSKLRRRNNAPLVLAWGISDKLTPLIERCMASLPKIGKVFGLMEPGSTNKYRHPLPSLQKDKQRWIKQILQQFDD